MITYGVLWQTLDRLSVADSNIRREYGYTNVSIRSLKILSLRFYYCGGKIEGGVRSRFHAVSHRSLYRTSCGKSIKRFEQSKKHRMRTQTNRLG